MTHVQININHNLLSRALHEQIAAWASEMSADDELMEAITNSTEAPPVDYVHQQGWALIAFRNALWQLLHAPNIEEAVVEMTPPPSVVRFLALCGVSGRDSRPMG